MKVQWLDVPTLIGLRVGVKQDAKVPCAGHILHVLAWRKVRKVHGSHSLIMKLAVHCETCQRAGDLAFEHLELLEEMTKP